MEIFKFWVKKKKEAAGYGRFVISPLPQGFGVTLGNALRRVLLGYMSGAAITQIKVKGANHPFAVIKGVKEDLIDVIMNIKQIKVAYDKKKPIKVHLEKTGPGPVKAGDIQLVSGVEIKNPDLVIANLADAKSKLKITFTIERGTGYSLAEDHKIDKMGIVTVDAIFSPVLKTNYEVKEIRVGEQKNMNELTMEVWVDETITPFSALKQAGETLSETFAAVANPSKKKVSAPKKTKKNSNLSLYLEELDLPLRLVNALKKAGFKQLSDFEGMQESDFIKVKNVGEKSCHQLIKILKKKGIRIKE